MLHKVSEVDIEAIIRPTVLLSHVKEIEISELADSVTDPTKNLQDNGAMLPVGIQSYLSHSFL